MLNALWAAETTSGRDGLVFERLPHEPVLELLASTAASAPRPLAPEERDQVAVLIERRELARPESVAATPS